MIEELRGGRAGSVSDRRKSVSDRRESVSDPNLREWYLPQFDRAVSALLGDLSGRGLLDETLIVVLSEMSRTPKINAAGGRDHRTHCYSTLLAGAGRCTRRWRSTRT
ncbi:MAG: DUF1501 domain-containing protein [Gemmataceae bacterium]